MLFAPVLQLLLERLARVELGIAPLGGFFEGAHLHGIILLGVILVDLLLVGLEVRRTHRGLHSHARAGFVDGVDCLVWQEPCGEIACGESDRRAQGLGREFHVVVVFVA